MSPRGVLRRAAALPRQRLRRADYRATWAALSRSERSAVVHVIGDVGEEHIRATAQDTLAALEATVGIHADDTVLEIGCGIGRVGLAVAPRCRTWIGCDVAPAMLHYAGARLAGLDNVRLVQVSGFDLKPLPAAVVDVVYCTVVFMHLEEWDRYRYVLEAHRVLRPGGRLYVDNFDLCSDEGWAVFEEHRRIEPSRRPAQISKASTPQELETYLRRAGFHDVRSEQAGLWVRAWGTR